tara:strand:- start:30 stop:137 length:108 start_codon:yes stop_codon:yes gene_type:complete
MSKTFFQKLAEVKSKPFKVEVKTETTKKKTTKKIK